MNRKFIGFEINNHFYNMAKEKLNQEILSYDLFSSNKPDLKGGENERPISEINNGK